MHWRLIKREYLAGRCALLHLTMSALHNRHYISASWPCIWHSVQKCMSWIHANVKSSASYQLSHPCFQDHTLALRAGVAFNSKAGARGCALGPFSVTSYPAFHGKWMLCSGMDSSTSGCMVSHLMSLHCVHAQVHLQCVFCDTTCV